MIEWTEQIFQQFGHAGVFFLMLLENIFPPIPSEIILPLSGFMAAQGTLNPIALLASSTAGAVSGALFWYYIGHKLGEARVEKWIGKHSRWLALSTQDYDKIVSFFNKHSAASVFFARMIPAFRSLISLPAGIFAMGFSKFLIYTTAGTLIWNSTLIFTGYMLQQKYTYISEMIGMAANLIIGGLLLIYVYRLTRAGLKK